MFLDDGFLGRPPEVRKLLAGIEPATLGLAVLRTADRGDACFQIMSGIKEECVRVRGIARGCDSLVTLRVTPPTVGSHLWLAETRAPRARRLLPT